MNGPVNHQPSASLLKRHTRCLKKTLHKPTNPPKKAALKKKCKKLKIFIIMLEILSLYEKNHY
jgi:hypothetical protein